MFNWEIFQGSITGTPVDGDLTAPPTRWWNHLFLALWGWRAVAVFKVGEADAAAGYRVGYKPSTGGPAKLKTHASHAPSFRMKVGRDDCTFFAVGPGGKEIPLQFVAFTNVDNLAYGALPLH